MYIDLHCHSIYSDGSYHPREILNMARQANIQILALTDHDTIAGSKEMLKLNLEGIKFIPAVELEAKLPKWKKTAHILGYGLNFDDQTEKQFEHIRTSRYERNCKIINKLKKLGLKFDLDEFINLSQVKGEEPLKNIGRPHIANYLVQKGYSINFEQAFAEYLSEQTGTAYASRDTITTKECIDFIHKLGGKAFIAHPNTLRLNNEMMNQLVGELKNNDLDGLEIYNSSIKDKHYTSFLKDLTKKYQLLFSGGSDFHGDFGNGVNLGQVCQNNKVKKITEKNVSPWFIETNFSH